MQVTSHPVTGVGPSPFLSTIILPLGAQILGASTQIAGLSSFALWALGDASAGPEKRVVLVMKTGDTAPSGVTPGAFIATCQLGVDYFHLFDQGG